MSKIIGSGAPTKTTPAVLGQEYLDKNTNQVYTCINVIHSVANTRSGEFNIETEWAIVGGGSSDSSFPSPTAADNGKVLQVVNGSPQWVVIENGNEVAY